MKKTAEAVSLGHPDKTADYISSYLLDRLIEQDPQTRYAVEVMIKDNTVILGGEITTTAQTGDVSMHVKQALREIGYTEEYAKIWKQNAIEINKIQVINLIGQQSPEIAQGVNQNGWGDQGVFVGFACAGDELINRELYLARTLNNALYQKALTSDNLGLDIKTQITLNENGRIETAVVAIPMLNKVDLTNFIIETLGEQPENMIINGTGAYKQHASIADCGITGRKLACDFYSTACPIGGGSPWTKDGSKADVALNLYARQLAMEHLGDNDACFVYLSSCIGKTKLPSATFKTIKNGIEKTGNLQIDLSPIEIRERLNLTKPIYTKLCRKGIV